MIKNNYFNGTGKYQTIFNNSLNDGNDVAITMNVLLSELYTNSNKEILTFIECIGIDGKPDTNTDINDLYKPHIKLITDSLQNIDKDGVIISNKLLWSVIAYHNDWVEEYYDKAINKFIEANVIK